MKQAWAQTWKASSQPRKQRKFAYNAPEHRRRKLLSAHLSPELRSTYGTRSMPLRVGDTVKVLRGGAKGKTGKIERIDTASMRLQIAGLDVSKKDGSKSSMLIRPSNVIATTLVVSDKRRFAAASGQVAKSRPQAQAQKTRTKEQKRQS